MLGLCKLQVAAERTFSKTTINLSKPDRRPEEIDKDEFVVRQGDSGDFFYILEEVRDVIER